MPQCIADAHSKSRTQHPMVVSTSSDTKGEPKNIVAQRAKLLGTRRTAITETYVTCARCNKATHLRYARIVQSDVLSESHSEYEYLCPECQKALANGEKDLPII